ncbi:MAG: cobalamin B12-binding domain-containing protein [Candidatus Omnitrophica bacterium]|nr:cobalamin B12-binding domain-containing protein [Candidatus Omnitrophota bacterium]
MRNYPPLFTVLKALTPKTYNFVEFNRCFWQRRYWRADKLVAISCYTSNCYEAYKIAKEFKKRGSKVVMGGPHVTFLPDEALVYCDSVVIGEAEGVWEDVIKDYENNSLKPVYSGVAKEDFYTKTHAELMNSPPEIIRDFLELTRGCKYQCHFCTIPLLSGGKVRKTPIPELVELFKRVRTKHKYIALLDNNIYNDPAYSKQLFEALKPLGIKWQSFCTIDIAKNKEAVRLAKESGCSMLCFGYEIFGGSLEDQNRGKLAMVDRYLEYSRIIQKAGIKIRGNFIYGWDSDNIKSLFKIWKFAFRLRPFLTVIAFLTPLPGSQLYYTMLKEDRLTNLNWRQYDCLDLVFDHKSISHTFLPKIFLRAIPLFLVITTSQTGWFMISASLLCAYLFSKITPH